MEDAWMVIGNIMKQFVNDAPFCVMARMALESIFSPVRLNLLFEKTARMQYTRELMFSSVVDLMVLIALRSSSSVNAAYKKKGAEIGVSITSLYNKLNGLEPNISRALVQYTAAESSALVRKLRGTCPPLLPGYRVKHLDGNHLGSTEHRLKVLREKGGGALPGLLLAVLDPETMVIEDVIPCEDGHTQECTLLQPLLETVRSHEVFVADRHYCTSEFLFGLKDRTGFFVIRQHMGHLRWRKAGRYRRVERGATGVVYEQELMLTNPQTGEEFRVRRITIRLDKPIRDGESELHILTNLPRADVDALTVGDLYGERWTIETAFQHLTVDLRCELNTLGYPPAALFSFSMAVACYNMLAILIAAMRSARAAEMIDDNLSYYYVTEELGGVYRGMLIALPPPMWQAFQTMTRAALAKELKKIACTIDLSKYQKSSRGPKQKKQPRAKSPRKHISTARLLKQAAEERKTQSKPP